MSDEATPTIEQTAVEQPTEAAPAPKPRPAKQPKAKEDAEPDAKPQPDPVMAKLVGYERELADLRKSLDAERARVKQFERASKKDRVLSALIDEFPGIPRNEIRGAALVAAEDGMVDLYDDDHEDVIAKLKEALRPKSKKPASAASPAASLGGTPGSAGKPPVAARKFLI